MTGAGDGSAALLVLGFESAEHDVEPWMSLALECCADHGGVWERGTAQPCARAMRSGAGARRFCARPICVTRSSPWVSSSETFETAITWDRFPDFHATVSERAAAAVKEVCGQGSVSCRFTHVYPDGPAAYFTILAPARAGDELEQWAQIKAAASDALIEAGGTITHHHAVGRDHRPWYDRQRPDPFASALRGAKAAVDPQAVLNPGVLIDPTH